MYKVRSSSLLIFRQPLLLVRFQTIEWRYKNNRRTLLSWSLSSLLEWMYFMDISKELNSKKNFLFSYTQRDTTHNFLIYRDVYFFRCGIFQGYFTWPCTDICLKGDNQRKWYGSICFSLHGSNVEKNGIWKNIF